jgi:anion-transporting  ArsA/GET3 family ATPase
MDLNDKLYFDNPYGENYEAKKLNYFIREILNNSIDITTLKMIARSELWKSYINSNSQAEHNINLNDDYRYLLSIHKMYENAKQHPEAPTEEIISDDDALDGWFLFQNQKMEKEKRKNVTLDKFGKKIKESDHVFILGENQQEIQEIYSLNDNKERMIAQQVIDASYNSKELVDWKDLPFVKQQLMEEKKPL